MTFCDWLVTTRRSPEPLRPVCLQVLRFDDGLELFDPMHLSPREAVRLARTLRRAARAGRLGRHFRRVLPPLDARRG